MRYTYWEHSFNGYHRTTRRPPCNIMRVLKRSATKDYKSARFHIPGMGWHHVPGTVFVGFNETYWFDQVPTSEDAILAYTEEICNLAGIDFAALYKKAYNKERRVIKITKGMRSMCARHATLEDAKAVYDDLEDVNYHSLSAEFAEALGIDWQED